jgi:hypothetical protein
MGVVTSMINHGAEGNAQDAEWNVRDAEWNAQSVNGMSRLLIECPGC